MKYLLILLCFCCFTSEAQVQKYILTTGANGYVTIAIKGQAPVDYTRGVIGAYFTVVSTGDTQMTISTWPSAYPSIYIPYVEDTNYQNGDASNGNFPNTDSLYRWTRRHLQKYVGN